MVAKITTTVTALLILTVLIQSPNATMRGSKNAPGSLAGIPSFLVHADQGHDDIDGDRDGSVDHQVICEVDRRTNIAALAHQYDMAMIEPLDDGAYVLNIPPTMTVAEAVALLRQDHDVKSVEPNYVITMPESDQRGTIFVDQRGTIFVDGQSPSDYFDQYALERIRATDAQAIAQGDGVTVAVIDTGIDPSHPIFSSHLHLEHHSDYIGLDNDPTEEGNGPAYGHGTMVAGIIALVAPEATIMPIRAFAANGQASTADVSNAIRQVVKSGADVINMSFGLPRDSKAIRRAIEFASQQSVELIAAAGNDGTSRRQYPAMYQSVLAVGATDRHDEKADFSNFGSYLDVGAPGVGIYSAYPNGQFGWGDGTSYSAALASGVAALVLSRRSPGATQVIKATAVVCCGGQLGRGRIDALDAVNH